MVSTMTREEYEQRKQRLEEQLRVGIELLQAAHRQQVRALDLIWMTNSEEDVKVPLAEEWPAAARPQAPSRAPRRQAGELYNDVLAALAKVPTTFDRNQVCEQLGYEPNRGSLYRVFQELIENGLISIQSRGDGQTPSRYRKTKAADRPTDV
jgi:hypothetical protein